MATSTTLIGNLQGILGRYLSTKDLLETSLLSRWDKEHFRHKVRKLKVKQGFPRSFLAMLATQKDLQHLDVDGIRPRRSNGQFSCDRECSAPDKGIELCRTLHHLSRLESL